MCEQLRSGPFALQCIAHYSYSRIRVGCTRHRMSVSPSVLALPPLNATFFRGILHLKYFPYVMVTSSVETSACERLCLRRAVPCPPACRNGCNRRSSARLFLAVSAVNRCSHPAKLMIAGWRTAVPPLLLLAAQVPPAPRSARRCSARRCSAPVPALRVPCMPRTAALSGGSGGAAAELIVGGARRDRRPLAAARAARGHRRGCDRNSRCTRRRPPTRGSRCTGHLAEVQHACGTH